MPARRAVRAVLLGIAAVAFALSAPGCRRNTRLAQEDLRSYLHGPSVSPVPFDPSALEGNVTVVIFFATWCLPCLGQLSLVRELQDEYGERGLRVVAVGMDLDGARMLRPFSEHYAPNVPVLVADEALRSGETPFGKVREVPVSLILDRQGRFRVGWPGVAEAADVRREVERALEQ